MHASLELIRGLFAYLRHADERVLGASETLTNERYFKAMPISAGSVHKMLVHCLGAQQVWLERWKGGEVRQLPGVKEYPTRQSVKDAWPRVHDALFAFLDAQSAGSIAAPLRYRNSRGEEYALPLGSLMVYLCDHATYHRGQINSMIKLGGGNPWPGSMQSFLIERSRS